jgi:hypothetical protein
MSLPARIERCRERARSYFASQRVELEDALFWRHSPAHDPARSPGYLLYGTWGGVHGTVLLDGDNALAGDRRRVATALGRFQLPDGTFNLPELAAADQDGHTKEYTAFHCTNYAWGALHALGAAPVRPPSFLEPFLDSDTLDRWLEHRDLTRPWTEGNNLINLASFYALVEGQRPAARARLLELRGWHDRHQRSDTGLWHSAGGSRTATMEYAIAGGAHDLHLYYYLGGPVPNAHRIVDSCLSLGYLGIVSACIDLDMVDILCHLRGLRHRVPEIDNVLRRYLLELLQVQNADGGFSDNYVTSQRSLGEVTPAGCSVTWVSWFRMATLGMIACTLMPEQRGRWKFRTTLGSGYFNPDFGGRADPPPPPTVVGQDALRYWLAARRKARWMRQRATYRVRAWVRGSLP